MKFRLLIGRHVDRHPRGITEPFYVVEGGVRKELTRVVQVTYSADIWGDPKADPPRPPSLPVFESDVDLCAKFNVPGFPPKFERVSDDTPCVYAGVEGFDPAVTPSPQREEKGEQTGGGKRQPAGAR